MIEPVEKAIAVVSLNDTQELVLTKLGEVAITRLGFKPQAHSESLLKKTGKEFQSILMDLSY